MAYVSTCVFQCSSSASRSANSKPFHIVSVASYHPAYLLCSMLSVHNECSSESEGCKEIHVVIRYLRSKNKCAVEIYQEIVATYGPYAMDD